MNVHLVSVFVFLPSSIIVLYKWCEMKYKRIEAWFIQELLLDSNETKKYKNYHFLFGKDNNQQWQQQQI